MRIVAAVVVAVVAAGVFALPALGLSAFAQTPRYQPAHGQALWSDAKDDEVRLMPCTGASDEHCGEIAIVQAGHELKRTNNGFIVTGVAVEWRRPSHAIGPDVVVSGTGGGSLGDLDIFSVTFGEATSIEEFSIDHAYDPNFHLIDGVPTFDLTFSVMDFALESNAETAAARVPMRWTGAKFDTDFTAMANLGPSPGQLDDMRRELLRRPRSLEDHVSKTVQTLLEMILAGEAAKAKKVLEADWRGDASMREEVWQRLCAKMTAGELWERLGLDRLNGAVIVKAAAARYPKDKLGPL